MKSHITEEISYKYLAPIGLLFFRKTYSTRDNERRYIPLTILLAMRDFSIFYMYIASFYCKDRSTVVSISH
jgi:hypothetical protein